MTDTSRPQLHAIDSHQHFWSPDGDYPWMVGPYAPLRRPVTPADLRPELAAAGVGKTILVQTWSSYEETVAFLKLAEATDFIAGVVGWVDLTAADVGERLDSLLAMPEGKWLVGIRHQVHDEPNADWLLRDDVRRGLAAVASRELAYDLLVRPRELGSALEIVKAFPRLRFVIDHIGKPDIRSGGFAAWSKALRPFGAHRSHVWCKLSGIVTEADWHAWTLAELMPYIAETIAIFGPSRSMLGSDWPVCNLAASYGQVIDLVRDHLGPMPADSRAAILYRSAIEAYRLDAGRL